MNGLNKEIIAFYQGAEEREQAYIVKIMKLKIENEKLKQENQQLRRRIGWQWKSLK